MYCNDVPCPISFLTVSLSFPLLVLTITKKSLLARQSSSRLARRFSSRALHRPPLNGSRRASVLFKQSSLLFCCCLFEKSGGEKTQPQRFAAYTTTPLLKLFVFLIASLDFNGLTPIFSSLHSMSISVGLRWRWKTISLSSQRQCDRRNSRVS